MIGRTLGHYRITEKIGAGGMGEVYRAHDERLGRDVALKVLPADALADEQARKRFQKEAKTLSQLNHPHIATVHDFDTEDGVDFLVMEYVAGDSLDDKLKTGPLSEKIIARLGEQTAAALEEAHEHGIIHRDLKPANVRLTPKGQAKILDFGIARLLEPAGVEATTQSFAETQALAGTLPYMSPEQLRGEAVDGRSDIYSLGVVLYEMASAQRPFQEKLSTALSDAILHRPPPSPRLANPRLTFELEHIILKCLEKDPERRYQSAKELAVDLRRLSYPAPPPAVDAGSDTQIAARLLRRHRLAAMITVAALLLVVAVAFYFASEPSGPVGVGAAGRPAIAVMPFDNAGGSPDTQWLSEGVPNMLLTGLAQTPGLDVISSQRLDEVLKQVGAEGKGRGLEAARRAGAGAVVTGSIFQAGPEMRIDVQVEGVESGRVLFARSVRGADVFPLVDELTEHIRSSLNLARATGRSISEVTSSSLEAYRLYNEGVRASDNARIPDARDLFEKAVEIDPSFAMAYFRLADVLRQMGDPERAEEYRQKVLAHLDRLPEREKLLVQADEARLEEKNPQKAVQLLEQLIERYPDAGNGYSELADIYAEELNQPEKTLEILEHGVKALPDSSLHNDYGYRLLWMGRHAEALREFETYVRLNPDEPNPLDSLAEAYLFTGQPEKALAGYARALELDPSFAGSYVARAWAFAMLGRYAEALAEMDKAEEGFRKANFPLFEIHFVRAFLLSRIGRYREAEQEIQRGLRLADNLKNEQLRFDFTALSVSLALERGEFKSVVAAGSRLDKMAAGLDEAVFPFRAPVLTHFLVGAAAARSGNLSAARARLESVKKIYDPEKDRQKRNYQWLAGEVALAAGDLDAAEAAFAAGEPPLKVRFNATDPLGVVFGHNSPLRDWQARIQKARGDLPGAIRTYRKLLTPAIASKWTAVHEPRYVLELARLLAEYGDNKGARKEYERFLELWKDADPGLPELRHARAEYAPLQDRTARAPAN